MVSFANTPKGKSQAKRLVECRISLGCSSAKEFYVRFSKNLSSDGGDLFSYTQYQKYESGERLLGRKASIQFAKIFKKNWEWLQNGTGEDNVDDECLVLTEEEKELIKALRRIKSSNEILSATEAC
jgi:hypothetical protein